MNITGLPGLSVVAGEQSPLTSGVKNIGIFRVLGDVAALATAHVIRPLPFFDAVAPRQKISPAFAWYSHGRVVLLRSRHLIRKIAGGGDVIELRGRKIFVGPGFAAVHRHATAPIVGRHHPGRVVGVNPEIVVVAVRNGDGFVELHTPIGRFIEAHIEAIDAVFVLWIGIDSGIIKRPLPQFSLLVNALPRHSGIVGTVNAPIFGFHNGPHPVWVNGRYRYANFTNGTSGHSRFAGQFGPGIAPVSRFKQARIATAPPHFPGFPIDFPNRGIQHIGISPVDDNINPARFVAFV